MTSRACPCLTPPTASHPQAATPALECQGISASSELSIAVNPILLALLLAGSIVIIHFKLFTTGIRAREAREELQGISNSGTCQVLVPVRRNSFLLLRLLRRGITLLRRGITTMQTPFHSLLLHRRVRSHRATTPMPQSLSRWRAAPPLLHMKHNSPSGTITSSSNITMLSKINIKIYILMTF